MAFLLSFPLPQRPAHSAKSPSRRCRRTIQAAAPEEKPRRRARPRTKPAPTETPPPPSPPPTTPSAPFTAAETAVLQTAPFSDARYGKCFNCGSAIAIPGLERFFCARCGWIRRPHEPATISPGHHD